MTLTAPTPGVIRPPPDTMRRTSLAAGVLYLLTFVSIPTLFLYDPVRNDENFVLGAGSSTGVLWGAFAEVVVALAGIGTAVVLYRVARRQSETAARRGPSAAARGRRSAPSVAAAPAVRR
jgi:hypothetical protein